LIELLAVFLEQAELDAAVLLPVFFGVVVNDGLGESVTLGDESLRIDTVISQPLCDCSGTGLR